MPDTRKKTGQVEQPVICRVLNVQTPPPNTVLTSCWQFWRMLKTFNQLCTSLMKEDTERSQEKDKTRIRKEVKTWLIQNKESYIWCLIDGCCIIVTIRWPHIMLSAMVIFFSADKDVDRFSASLAFTFLQKERCNGQQWSYFGDKNHATFVWIDLGWPFRECRGQKEELI